MLVSMIEVFNIVVFPLPAWLMKYGSQLLNPRSTRSVFIKVRGYSIEILSIEIEIIHYVIQKNYNTS